MKWLQDNFVGMALLGGIVGLLLVSFVLAIVWAWPVSSQITEQAAQEAEAATRVAVVTEVGPVSDYQVINERPVFNVSREPEAVEGGDLTDVGGEPEIEVKGAPEVRLTGIYISPNLRIASLMPIQGEQISVSTKEGEPLIGEYVGWEVSKVQPRHVVLTSRDGQTLKLELKVHDVKIEEPPKIEVPTAVAAAAGEEDVPVGEDGEPLSRAEQIRARIAERREELRRQQQGESDEQTEGGGQSSNAAPPPDYQSAIRSMINNRTKDKDSNDEKDS